MAKSTSNPNGVEVAASRAASTMLILFMIALPFLGGLGEDVLIWIAILMSFPLGAFIAIEFLETNNRDITDEAGFLADNGLAILAVIIGVLTLGLWIFHVSGYGDMTLIQLIIEFACLFFAAIDLTFGLLFSLRIAGSGKQRVEELAH